MVTPYGFYKANVAVGWEGYNFDLLNDIYLGYGQAIDLQRAKGQNGYISQKITLPSESYCNLSFYQQAHDNNFNNYVM